MKREEFYIGLEFRCGGKRWRCTDVGSRVIVAISLEPHRITRARIDDKDPANRIASQYTTDDPSWLTGPPYAVAEYVFDEESLVACTRSRDEAGE